MPAGPVRAEVLLYSKVEMRAAAKNVFPHMFVMIAGLFSVFSVTAVCSAELLESTETLRFLGTRSKPRNNHSSGSKVTMEDVNMQPPEILK